MRFSAILSAAALAVSASVASAATFNVNISGNFSGGELGTVEFDLSFTEDLNFTGDPSGFVTGTVTVNTLTSDTGGGPVALPLPFVQYTYGSTSDTLVINYSDSNAFIGSLPVKALSFSISDFLTGPQTYFTISDSQDETALTLVLGCYATNAILCDDSGLEEFITYVPITPGALNVSLLPVTDDDMPAVPLPASALLLSGGLLGLGAFGRRRRNTA